MHNHLSLSFLERAFFQVFFFKYYFFLIRFIAFSAREVFFPLFQICGISPPPSERRKFFYILFVIVLSLFFSGMDYMIWLFINSVEKRKIKGRAIIWQWLSLDSQSLIYEWSSSRHSFCDLLFICVFSLSRSFFLLSLLLVHTFENMVLFSISCLDWTIRSKKCAFKGNLSICLFSLLSIHDVIFLFAIISHLLKRVGSQK